MNASVEEEVVDMGFGYYRQVEPCIVEITSHEGAQVTGEDMDLLHDVSIAGHRKAFGLLVNKKHDYGYSASGVAKLFHPRKCATAVVVSARHKTETLYSMKQSSVSKGWNMRLFVAWDDAIAWLRQEVAMANAVR